MAIDTRTRKPEPGYLNLSNIVSHAALRNHELE